MRGYRAGDAGYGAGDVRMRGYGVGDAEIVGMWAAGVQGCGLWDMELRRQGCGGTGLGM